MEIKQVNIKNIMKNLFIDMAELAFLNLNLESKHAKMRGSVLLEACTVILEYSLKNDILSIEELPSPKNLIRQFHKEDLQYQANPNRQNLSPDCSHHQQHAWDYCKSLKSHIPHQDTNEVDSDFYKGK